MNNEDRKKLANELYKREELVWSTLTSQYYTPHGAPGRLSRDLLERWHEKHNTGAREPSEIQGCLVKVSLSDNSYMIKKFVTPASAERYISDLLKHDIEGRILNSYEEAHDFGR